MAHRAGTRKLSEDPLPTRAIDFLAQEDRIRAIFDVGGKLLGANPPYFDAMHRRAEDIIGTYFWDFMNPHTLEASLRALDHVSMSGSVHGVVNCWRRGDGGLVWLKWDCEQAGTDGLLYATAEPIEAPAGHTLSTG